MTDLVALANLSITVLGKTTEALTGLRERAQRSKDVDIKDGINTLFDNLLQLKDVVSRLLDVIEQQKREIEKQQLARVAVPKMRQVGEANYYFQGDEGPFCQTCYSVKHTLVPLQPQVKDFDGSVWRKCTVCDHIFYEVRPKDVQPRIEPFSWS